VYPVSVNKTYAAISGVKPTRESDSDPIPQRVVPFGLNIVGSLTGHPVGLLVVAAVCFSAWRVPEARSFTLFSVPVGILVGLVLWFRNRRRTFASPLSLRRNSF
jgi:hypothetical protein